jgi:deoxyadenosine/deoxycytidine kinase
MSAAENLTMPEQVSHFCIEGVIGAGKTSLARMLADYFEARLVLEMHEENPFLAGFYDDRRYYAFQTQMWFLLSRYRQLTEVFVQQDLFHKLTISDYMFAKDRLFASINLDENELALYNGIAGALEAKAPPIDFVVYLQTSTDILMKRIAGRKRPYEASIDREYIDMLNQAYNHYFFHYTATPLLIINCNDIDFVHKKEDFEEILRQIVQAKPGSNYYHPLGAGNALPGQGRKGSEA